MADGINRRLAAGRLSELLGAAALPTDKFLRTLGIRRAAQRSYETLDEPHRLLVDAYVDGVNAFLASRSGPLPPEFLLLRASAPEPWTAADSIAWSLMMAWDLASHGMRMELRRLRLAQRFSRAEIDDIYPPLPGESAPGVGDYVEMYRLIGAFATVPEAKPPTRAEIPTGIFGTGESVGSNNWVLSGQRTVSGRPLLANDPHLALTTPPVWYFAAMRLPGLELIGATLPGLPGIVLGRNDRVAWGMTTPASISRICISNGSSAKTKTSTKRRWVLSPSKNARKRFESVGRPMSNWPFARPGTGQC